MRLTGRSKEMASQVRGRDCDLGSLVTGAKWDFYCAALLFLPVSAMEN